MVLTATSILILVFVAIDVAIDNWIDKEFDDGLITKSNYLKTLVKDTPNGIEFDFSGEFMPEFSLPAQGEYFQLWQAGKVLERSESLKHFENINLENPSLAINTSKFYSGLLPDGREGRIMTSFFLPQVDSKQRTELSASELPIQLTLAISTEELDNLLIIIDSSLWVGLILIIIIMRWAVNKVIIRGLQPLQSFNQSLRNAAITHKEIQFPTDAESFREIQPIKNELQKFINLNQQHLKNEKRITADIAHELKTPISELISLSEVYIRYPEDERIGGTYKQDVLNISLKMKGIVANLLLLQQSHSESIKLNQESLSPNAVFEQVFEELHFKYAELYQRVKLNNNIDDAMCFADKFSLHTVLSNLVDNALFYSPTHTDIDVNLSMINHAQHPSYIIISIENFISEHISEEDLEQLTLPLFQVEKSRTDQSRHGLGLAIVSNIAHKNNFDFKVKLQQTHRITFEIKVPVDINK
jgi:signal transduction histidine kinase